MQKPPFKAAFAPGRRSKGGCAELHTLFCRKVEQTYRALLSAASINTLPADRFVGKRLRIRQADGGLAPGLCSLGRRVGDILEDGNGFRTRIEIDDPKPFQV